VRFPPEPTDARRAAACKGTAVGYTMSYVIFCFPLVCCRMSLPLFLVRSGGFLRLTLGTHSWPVMQVTVYAQATEAEVAVGEVYKVSFAFSKQRTAFIDQSYLLSKHIHYRSTFPSPSACDSDVATTVPRMCAFLKKLSATQIREFRCVTLSILPPTSTGPRQSHHQLTA
jgi:hypothetical protein